MRISDWSSDLIAEHLRIGKGAVEIEMVDQVSAFQFGKESPAIGIEPPPRAPPRCPAPAIGSLQEIGFGQWSVRGKDVSMDRSEERSVGKECVSTCRSRWSLYHKKKN